ncbi:MAG: polymer-forming cytoskeletal protein [Bacteroidota bacterium]
MADKNGMKDLNLIGVGTTVDGKIRTQGSLRVDGKLTGEVHAAENLAIGVTGEIEGAVNGRNVTIGGKVKGNITAVDKLVLEGKSSVRGDVKAAKLVIDEGAMFDGRISMTENRPGGQNY